MYKIKQIPEDFIVEEIPLFEPKEKGEFTYFILEKKGYDTEKVIKKISEHFKIQRKKFNYAGSKDRHAITKQYCSVRGKIRNFDFEDFKIKIIGYGNEPISLGSLKGNKFTITVRSIKEKPKPTNFIINYFDEQRFGKNNLEIGLSIIKKDFRNAAELIDLPDAKFHLTQNKNDFIGAIKKVPFRIMNMYIHAVQSWLWNETSAEYIKQKTKKFSEIKYNHGKFIFPVKKITNIEIPLISFDTEFENKEIEEIYKKIMEKQKLSLRDFIIRQIPDITPLGGERNLIAEVRELSFGKLENDELNIGKKKITLAFELGKGSYATIVIKTIL